MESLMNLTGRTVRFLYTKGEEQQERCVKVERVFKNRFNKWVIHGIDMIENEYRSFSAEKCDIPGFVIV